MLGNVLSGGISNASVLTLGPADVKAVMVHFNIGSSVEDEVRLKIDHVDLVGWKQQVMGFIHKAAHEAEAIYTDHGPAPVGGGRLVATPKSRALAAAPGKLGTDYDVVRKALTLKDPTLVFPLRLGRSASFYDSNAHVTLSKSGAEDLAVWLDRLLEQT